MSQRLIREQVRQAFAALTRPPGPELAGRISDSIWARPVSAARAAGIRASRMRSRVLPAAVLVLLLLVVLVAGAVPAAPALGREVSVLGRQVSARLLPPASGARPSPRAGAPSPAPSAARSPAATPTAVPTAVPTPPPIPPVVPLAGYTCAAVSRAGAGQATMTAARTGAHGAFDRFVVQFSGDVPAFDVVPQDGATFPADGGTVALRGSAGLVVQLHGTSGGGAFGGPTDLPQGFAVIQEARLLGDSGGVVRWGIGISHATCYHAWTLDSPSRLVVDVQA